MEIFDFDDYKAFVQKTIEAMPRRGHGQFRRLSEYLNVNSVVVSQVIRGDKHFTLEQAVRVGRFLNLAKSASDYFVTLVSKERAGSHELKTHYETRLEELRSQARHLKSKVAPSAEISDEHKSVFYSDWFYSAVHLLTSIPEYRSVSAIAKQVKLSEEKVIQILDFLLSCGLVIEDAGEFKIGTKATYIDATSRYINLHHRNWRLRAIERLNDRAVNDFFYSGSYSISAEDFDKIRKEIVEAVSKASKRVADTKPESLACLNIDWFRF